MSILGKVADKKRFKLIVKELDRQAKILDLGCGEGWLVKRLNSIGVKAIGIDKNLKKETEYLKRDDAYDMPFPDDSFDFIIAIEVIEHLKPRIYNEIKRVLKPGGKLIITTPKPEWDWLTQFLAKIGLADKINTPHINLVRANDLPFTLMKYQSILLFEWFGVFKNRK